jgi:hypothetical protein
MIHYIVKIIKHSTFFDEWYIKRVVNYKNNKVVLVPFENNAFKYVSKDNAEKASIAFNGKVEAV